MPPKSIPLGEWNIVAESQELVGRVYRLRGHPAEVEDSRVLVRANEIDWNQDTGEIRASGNVYFHSFDRNQQIWASRVEYDTDAETGKFYNVSGETHPQIVVRPGVLTSSSPYHFEGEWAERIGERYILHNGWVTNCKLPNPWWRMRGPRFEIVPGQKAVSHHSVFILRHMPIFYAPYFYHSLAPQPRKSGFLMPNIGHSSRRGEMLGIGYFWALNRSYDMTYRIQDFTARGFTHHLDFRAKPNDRSDFDAVLYGVQDRGVSTGPDNPPLKFSGISLYAVGRSDLGRGWTARGTMNYISSFRFLQEWTESFNEAIVSEIHSVGFVNKTWSTYNLDIAASRLQNYESTELPRFNADKSVTYQPNAVTIRKLPEAQFSGRDRRLWSGIPLWFSFESAAGLLYRAAPFFEGFTLVDRFETGRFSNRVNLAPHLTTALHLGDFHIVPSLGIRETYYSEGQAPLDGRYTVVGTNLVRSARDLSVDFVFPSLVRIFDKKTLFGEKLKHVIEPRATYRYVTGIGQNFNKFIRFDENDLLADTNELEISVTNRLFAKRGGTVQEVLTWEVAQKRYFDPTFGGALLTGQRNVFESSATLTAYAFLVGPRVASPVASLLRASPIPSVGITWQADYDPIRRGIVDSAFSADYRWQRYFVSAGHNQVYNNPLLAPPANQFRGRAGFGDANRRGWNAVFDAVYDYRKSVIQYSTVTATYNTDCCGLSLQYRRYNVGIRNESQYRVAFSIANIGSFGTLRKQDRLF